MSVLRHAFKLSCFLPANSTGATILKGSTSSNDKVWGINMNVLCLRVIGGELGKDLVEESGKRDHFLLRRGRKDHTCSVGENAAIEEC